MRRARLAARACAHALLAAAGLALGVAPRAGPAAAEAPPLPRFEPAPCPMPGAAAYEPERLRCGYLVVPESRGAGAGRTLRLAVARLASRAGEPAPDPVLFLHGGPGGGALERWREWLEADVLDRRELILLDQRGAGHSQPVLCPELPRADFRILARDLSPEEQEAERLARTLQCRDALRAEGVDLGAYNSDASAADVADLRRALGIEAWNLWGVSYGTKLALTVLRDHPEGVRSVVLDSVYPPGIPGNVQFQEFARAVDRLVQGCAADPACAEAFPDLAREIAQALEGLRRRPLEVPVRDRDLVPGGVFFVNPQDFAVSLHQGLYDRRMIPLLPLLIRSTRQREAHRMEALVDAAAARAEGINRAVYHAVECYERGPFMTGSPPGARYPELRRAFTYFDLDPLVCAEWAPREHAGPEEARPVHSDLPVLILAGEYDPITPPAWGRRAAETLPRSHFLLFPGVGHGAGFSGACARRVVTDFLDAPQRAPDASCVEALEPPDFATDLLDEPGVYRLARALFLDPRPGLRLALGVVAAGLAVAAFGWPLAAWLRRRRGGPPRAPTEHRARLLLGSAAALALAFLAGLLALLAVVGSRNPYVVGFGAPGWSAPLFWLPPLAAAVTAVGLAVVLPAWAAMPARARWLHSAVLAALAGFFSICLGFGLL